MVLLGVDNAGKTTTLEQLKALFGLKAMPPERRAFGWGESCPQSTWIILYSLTDSCNGSLTFASCS